MGAGINARTANGRRGGKQLCAVVALLGVTVVAACGDSDTPTSEQAAAGTTPQSGPRESEGVFDYVAYVGGEAGPADKSLEPYTIGYVNTEGGSIPPIGPQATPATEFAV